MTNRPSIETTLRPGEEIVVHTEGCRINGKLLDSERWIIRVSETGWVTAEKDVRKYG